MEYVFQVRSNILYMHINIVYMHMISIIPESSEMLAGTKKVVQKGCNQKKLSNERCKDI